MTRRSLTFVEPTPEAFAAACRQRLDEGGRRVLLFPFNDVARVVRSLIQGDVSRVGGVIVAEPDAIASAPGGCLAGGIDDADVIVVCESDEPSVSMRLLALIDVDATVVAATGQRHWSRHPLFLISIPKAGTHLLYSLATALGYRSTVVFQDDPAPGSWYCVEYSNSHTVARDFFVDTVRRSPYGNRHHPFMRSPALFIYRNPLDVVASEASYYHRDGKTTFAGYFDSLAPEARLLRLIDDPWLLGSIRDRVGGFIPWLDLPNVIPVSFEELVGAEGGGSAALQQRAIWSIQLKLQVPGSPAELARTLFNPDSPTFDQARIGRYRDVFTGEAYRQFFALPQDFMHAYGFADADSLDPVLVPGRADEFRRRPLRVQKSRPEVPVTIQDGYLGFNILRFGDRYFAVNQADGDLDVRSETIEALQTEGRVIVARTAEEARRGAEYLSVRDLLRRVAAEDALLKAQQEEEAKQWVTVRPDWHGYNIVAHARRFYAVHQSLGPCDLEAVDMTVLQSSGALLVADTQDAVEAVAETESLRHPRTVHSDCYGFNIVALGGRFYAVAQSLGNCDLVTADIPALIMRGDVLVGATQDAVEAAALAQPAPQPILIRANPTGFNIIKFGDRFYAVAHRLGPFDPSTADIPALLVAGDMLAGGSPTAVQALIDARVGTALKSSGR